MLHITIDDSIRCFFEKLDLFLRFGRSCSLEGIMKTVVLSLLVTMVMAASAQAVTVWEIRRACGADGKNYCPKAGYGDPMKVCLNKNLAKLAPSCKVIMGRINGGERVRLF
jgi:hypothetical protein